MSQNIELRSRASQPLRLSLVGCGYWGTKLLRVFSGLETVKICYVCDQQLETRNWLSQNYPSIHFLTDYRELLQRDCEVIVVATPASSHYDIAHDCLKAGKHVFVEKPLALNRDQAEYLRRLSQHLGLILFVGHTFEFDPAIAKIREIVESRELGQVFYVDSIRSNLGLLRLDVNIVWDLLIHDVSVLYKIFGMLPFEVSAIGSCHITQGFRNICESCYVNMRIDHGFHFSARASWLEPIKTRQLRIIGSQRSLIFDPVDKNNIQIYDSGIDLDRHEKEVNICYRRGNRYKIEYSNEESLKIEANAFINSILNNNESNARSAVEIVGVLEAIQASLTRQGAWVQVQ